MKRISLILVSILLIISLSGCKKEPPVVEEKLEVSISLLDTYNDKQTIDIELKINGGGSYDKAWIGIIPLEISSTPIVARKDALDSKYLKDISESKVVFANPGQGEWLVIVLEDEDSGNIVTKKSFKVIEKQEDPIDQPVEEPEPSTLSLVSDATKLVAEIEDSTYVFYYSGNKITGIENYYAFLDSQTAKASVELIRQANQDDPEVDEVYALERYVVVKYLPISYESLTRNDVVNIYSIDTSTIDFKSYFLEKYGDDLLSFQIKLEGQLLTYYCKDGMTIYDFLDSEGNIDGYYLDDDIIYDYLGTNTIDYCDDGFIYAIVPDEIFNCSPSE